MPPVLPVIMEVALCTHDKDKKAVISQDSGATIDTANTSNQAIQSSSRQESRCVRFSRVEVFYFNRQQGFSSVPERGGCTLGMAKTHFHSENYGALQYCRIRRIEKKLQHVRYNGVPKGHRKKRKSKFCDDEDVQCLRSGDSRRVPAFELAPLLSPQPLEPLNSAFRSPMIGATPPPPCLSPPNDCFHTPNPQKVDIEGAAVEHFDNFDTDSDASMDSFSACPNPPSEIAKSKIKLIPLNSTVRSRLLKQSGVQLLNCIFYCPFYSTLDFLPTSCG